VSGGGYPGWLQRNPATLRTRDPIYLNATNNYVSRVAQMVARAQITNGGPVILVQVENEYSVGVAFPEFPDPVYFKYVEDQYRNSGIVVPIINNDNFPFGNFAPGPPRKAAAVDIYGHDGYPLGFDCADPANWPDGALPTYYGALHEAQSSSTPYSIIEFQGGSFDPWGGPGFANCAALTNAEFEHVFFKNDFSFGVTIFNLYMTYGGTNWGNLGHPGGYTSYDYGAVIAEDRTVSREKYHAAKLLANFLQVSPAYLTAIPQSNAFAAGQFTGNLAIYTTALLGNVTNFYVVRQTQYNTLATNQYNITLHTSQGKIQIPQLGGSLSLHGRDSKVFVTDYDVGGIHLLYSTAEIFTWKRYGDQRVLVVYGGLGEENELAFADAGSAALVQGADVKIANRNGTAIINYAIANTTGSSTRRHDTSRVVKLPKLTVHLLDRASASEFWVVDLPNDPVSGNYTNSTRSLSAPIVRGGYLLRTAQVDGNDMHLSGDLNETSTLQVIGGAPTGLKSLTFNGKALQFKKDGLGVVTATAQYTPQEIQVPDLSTARWSVIDSLPEIQPGYDDSLWPSANLTHSNNTAALLSTPQSLFASDYGFNTGNLLFRGHFAANGLESNINLNTQGGTAFGHSVWLNGTFIGSFAGDAGDSSTSQTYNLPRLTSGQPYVLTILLDNMGLDENGVIGTSQMKNPRGILNFNLGGHVQSDISWKLTGNLHGEDYEDRVRGPLNEGGLFIERQGFHLPGAPIAGWNTSIGGPTQGLRAPGVSFYAVNFDLDIPDGYDVPISVVFANSTTATNSSSTGSAAYRCQIYVNGYQFGKYVNNIGPQHEFPVPEGIWNYHGSNSLGITLWALDANGSAVGELALKAGRPIMTSYGPVVNSPMDGWSRREGAY